MSNADELRSPDGQVTPQDTATTSEKPELLPCPFCGGEVELINHAEPHGEDYQVQCNNAECKMAMVETFCELGDKQSAIAAWNTRPSKQQELTEDEAVEVMQTAWMYNQSEIGADVSDKGNLLAAYRALKAAREGL